MMGRTAHGDIVSSCAATRAPLEPSLDVGPCNALASLGVQIDEVIISAKIIRLVFFLKSHSAHSTNADMAPFLTSLPWGGGARGWSNTVPCHMGHVGVR